jgi:8-oxo-dGTP pyrophosphatase MutT (NUDIX family)
MLEIDPHRPPSPPRDAATVALLRDRPSRIARHNDSAPEATATGPSGIEVFLVRRHRRSGFMADAHVFPGGKLDATDADPALRARLRGRSPDDAAAVLGESDADRALALFVAAIRETFEESGVLLADIPKPPRLDEARRALASGVAFREVLDTLDVHLRLDLLVPQARWVTPAVEPRRFDTRFFIARAPAAQRASHDPRETTDALWLAPADAIARNASGELRLPPPTLRTLEWLARWPDVDAALAAAGSRPPPYVDPVFFEVDGVAALALPGDPQHPTRTPALEGPSRIVLDGGRWWSRPAEGL